MDITKITDINQLKALVYDRLAVVQNAEQEIKALNQRISELVASEQAKTDTEQSKK